MPLVMRWAHLGAAVVSVGGLAFFVGVVLPGLRSADPEQAVLLLREMLRRVRTGLGACALLLVVSGVYAAVQARPESPALYHGVLGLKVLLGIAFLGAAAAGTALGNAAAGLSRRRTDLLWLGLVLGVATVLLSSYLRQLGSL